MILYYRFRQLSSLGLIALTGFAVFLFGAVDSPTVTIIQVALAALALAWALRKLRNPYRFVASAFYLPLLVIVGAAGVQTLFSLSASTHATESGLALWLAYLAFFVVAVNVQADPMIRRTWPTAACWLGLGAGLMAMLQALVNRGGVLWRAGPGLQAFGPFANVEILRRDGGAALSLLTGHRTRHQPAALSGNRCRGGSRRRSLGGRLPDWISAAHFPTRGHSHR